eukprot:gene13128-8974_t
MYICARCVSVCGFDGFIHCTVCFKVLICVGLCVLNRYVSELLTSVNGRSVLFLESFSVGPLISKNVTGWESPYCQDLLVGGSQTTRNEVLCFEFWIC